MTDKHFNAHRKNKKSVQLMLTAEEYAEFERAKQESSAVSAKEFVLELIRAVRR